MELVMSPSGEPPAAGVRPHVRGGGALPGGFAVFFFFKPRVVVNVEVKRTTLLMGQGGETPFRRPPTPTRRRCRQSALPVVLGFFRRR